MEEMVGEMATREEALKNKRFSEKEKLIWFMVYKLGYKRALLPIRERKMFSRILDLIREHADDGK